MMSFSSAFLSKKTSSYAAVPRTQQQQQQQQQQGMKKMMMRDSRDSMESREMYYSSPYDDSSSSNNNDDDVTMNFFAVGVDKFLKGSRTAAGPWTPLDQTKQILDVSVTISQLTSKLMLLGVGADDNLLYIKDAINMPWRLALPPSDPARAISVTARQDGSLLIVGVDFRRYARANLDPATPWTAEYHGDEAILSVDPVSAASLDAASATAARMETDGMALAANGTNTNNNITKFLAVGANARMYITDGYKSPWSLVSPLSQEALQDVAVSRVSSKIFGVDAMNMVATRADLLAGTPWVSLGADSCCVTRISSSNEEEDDAAGGAAGAALGGATPLGGGDGVSNVSMDAWYAYYAVGALDKLLKGSNTLSGPWMPLDPEKKEILDVVSVRLPSSSSETSASLVAVGAADNLLYAKDSLSLPWRLALPASDPVRAISVSARQDGSLLIVGVDFRRYARANLDAATPWTEEYHPDEALAAVDEVPTMAGKFLGVGAGNKRLYTTDGSRAAWTLVSPLDESESLIDATVDREANMTTIIGVDASSSTVITRANLMASTPWLNQGASSCCVSRVTSGSVANGGGAGGEDDGTQQQPLGAGTSGNGEWGGGV
jgi:hypothetical protein